MNGCIEYTRAIRRIAQEIPLESGSFLVTGASGLIGTCITDALTEANRTFGKRFTVYAMGRSGEKLRERFGETPDVRLIARNVTEPMPEEDFDYIIHAASNADPGSYALYPAETILTNVLGARNVLEYCRGRKTRALLTSSFEVYGQAGKDEYGEKDYGTVDLDLIRSCYPESKRSAELLFRAYHDEYGVDCVTVRLSSVYGPTMQPNDSKAHAQFLRNALDGKDIVLKSKGTQKRSWCYVMDAVSGIFTALLKGKAGEAYNVAHSAATIAEAAAMIAELAGTGIAFGEPDETEKKGFSRPQNCILKTEKLRALGWEGRYELRAGLSETLTILRKMKEQRKNV